MILCKSIAELRALLKPLKTQGKTVGLVPTMGALHAGHGSLIAASARENDFTVVSVFVNPTQFGPNEDLDAYPRTLESDCQLAEKMGANAVFAPSVHEMYPSEDMTWVEVTGNITKVLCGKSRPIHFRGVTTVVAKLFLIAAPDRAYFGQKDAQQAEVIKRMVKDLFFDLELRIMPIVREEDGLAKSSRNTYLNAKERQAALCLSRSLKEAERLYRSGERNPEVLKKAVRNVLNAEPLAEIDYVDIYAVPGLKEPAVPLTGENLLAIAVKIGTTRLIDNVVLGDITTC